MNVTETKAKAWLESQGLQVFYMGNRNPDFIDANGNGYEIKLIRGDCVVLSDKQLGDLNSYQGNLKILAFHIGDDEPTIMTLTELLTMKMGVKPVFTKVINLFTVKVELAEEEVIELKCKVIDEHTTIKDWVADAIRRKLKEDQSGRTSK